MLAARAFPIVVFEAILRNTLSENEIKDKSKADPFTKLLAILQILWLVVSVIARKVRHFATSQLEIVTLAFAVLAILIYAACWDKPQNVEEATLVTVRMDESDSCHADLVAALQKNQLTPLFSGWLGMEINQDRVPNDDINGPDSGISLIITTLGMSAVALLFGGLHCLAWNFEFPSEPERLIWRCASLASAMIPALELGIIVILSSLSTSGWMFRLNVITIMLLYVLARVSLLVIAFTCLRSMPADVYTTTWTKYLPNLQ